MNTQTAEYGYCHCGCGEKTEIATRNRWDIPGYIKDQPRPYLSHHKRHPGYKKAKERRKRDRYWEVRAYEHPKASAKGWIGEHIIIVEKALGRHLPDGVEVHHFNEDGHDNSRGNLVICQDHAYHMLLHIRARAVRACGNPNYRKCRRCGGWDDPERMNRAQGKELNAFRHAACERNDTHVAA